MPQFFAASEDGQQPRGSRTNEHKNMWSRLSFQKIGNWLKREEEEPPPLGSENEKRNSQDHDESNKENGRPSGGLGRRPSRRVVPGLPRPLTFKRQQSEMRDRLCPAPAETQERRAASADRRGNGGASRGLSPPPISQPSLSAPEVRSPIQTPFQASSIIGGGEGSNIPPGSRQVDYSSDNSIGQLPPGEPPPPLSTTGDMTDLHDSASAIDENLLQEELDAKWILNLSMHFRDMSDREKFFITYAEEPTKWRRVTVSCDYRDIQPDSLELDLKTLHYQRDKSARIYESIRDSLLDIQFYDTVTNLKLQTADGRLHVHVTEDVNEIIPYPSVAALDHVSCERFRESSVSFDSHISGFVYKVNVRDRVYIKKEIPGPDAVEEFLYEINALYNLQDSKSVIRFEGIIVSDSGDLVKGLLISYAEQGALVDLIYDWKNTERLPWERRERWAKQIVEGLSEVHEAGFVQGDFTLSNIVIDEKDDAKIIDINRRGCPVGWEPPELARLIESGQRISIYIGVKSDLFQLGMVLWALAEEQDEPERQERPLAHYLSQSNGVPQYFRDLVAACLDSNPWGRPAAKDALRLFPDVSSGQPWLVANARHRSVSPHRSDREHVDPSTTVDLDDISSFRRRVSSLPRSSLSNDGISRPTTPFVGSSGSYIVAGLNGGDRRYVYSPFPDDRPRSIVSLDDSELENDLPSLPASRETRWEQVYVDGDTRLVQRGALSIDARDFASQDRDPATVCITTPPGELSLEDSLDGSGAKTDDLGTPLQLSTVAELQPPVSATANTNTATSTANANAHLTSNGSPPRNAHAHLPDLTNASFIDRVHTLRDQHEVPHDDSSGEDDLRSVSELNEALRHLDHRPHERIDTNILARLEDEVGLESSVTESAVTVSNVTRVNTGFSTISNHFSPPVHQDSGFNEPEVNLEAFASDVEKIRKGIAEKRSERVLRNARVEGRMWKEDSGIGETNENVVLQPRIEKAVEEKGSSNTIRPPSILIPEFHHSVPRAVEVDEDKKEGKGKE